MKPGRAIQKNSACLQNALIIGSPSHSIKFFHKKNIPRDNENIATS